MGWVLPRKKQGERSAAKLHLKKLVPVSGRAAATSGAVSAKFPANPDELRLLPRLRWLAEQYWENGPVRRCFSGIHPTRMSDETERTLRSREGRGAALTAFSTAMVGWLAHTGVFGQRGRPLGVSEQDLLEGPTGEGGVSVRLGETMAAVAAGKRGGGFCTASPQGDGVRWIIREGARKESLRSLTGRPVASYAAA